jgi:hypothetical protein
MRIGQSSGISVCKIIYITQKEDFLDEVVQKNKKVLEVVEHHIEMLRSS